MLYALVLLDQLGQVDLHVLKEDFDFQLKLIKAPLERWLFQRLL